VWFLAPKTLPLPASRTPSPAYIRLFVSIDELPHEASSRAPAIVACGQSSPIHSLAAGGSGRLTRHRTAFSTQGDGFGNPPRRGDERRPGPTGAARHTHGFAPHHGQTGRPVEGDGAKRAPGAPTDGVLERRGSEGPGRVFEALRDGLAPELHFDTKQGDDPGRAPTYARVATVMRSRACAREEAGRGWGHARSGKDLSSFSLLLRVVGGGGGGWWGGGGVVGKLRWEREAHLADGGPIPPTADLEGP